MKNKVQTATLALLFLIFAFSSFIIARPYFHSGFPYTHDGENHLARFANYYLAVKEGQFPPRFAPGLMNHFGYPVFNYNYPLANIFSLPFSILKFNYEITFKIIMLLCLIAIAIAIYYSFQQKNKSPAINSLLLISLIFSSPYLLNIIYFRGNIGELMSFTFLLWIVILLIHTGKKFSQKYFFLLFTLLLTAFFLSHNIMVLIGTPLIIFLAAINLYSPQNNIKKNPLKSVSPLIQNKSTKKSFFGQQTLKRYRSFLISFSCALGLSLWFWLPAFFEKSLTVLDQAELSQDYLSHFPTVSELLFAPLSFGFSLIGSIDTLSFSYGMPIIIASLVMITFIIFLFFFKKDPNRNSAHFKKIIPHFSRSQCILIISILLVFIITIFLQSRFSTGIYKILPFLNYIQFPWRWQAISLICLITIAIKTFPILPQWCKYLLIMILFFNTWQNYHDLQPADYFHRQNIDYQAFSQSTSTAHENLPQTWHFTDFSQGWQPNVSVQPEQAGESTIQKFTTSHKKYRLILNSPATIIEPTMYFAGFQTTVNQQQIPYTDDEQIAGRIAYQLPAGEYEIETKFTQKTPSRLIGNTSFFIALIVLTTYSFKFLSSPNNKLK